MKLRLISLVTLIAFTLGVSGCATLSEENSGAAGGAGIGAVTGALAGAVLAGEGSRTKGAIIGGLAGALIGGVIGNYTVDRKKTAAETATKYGYSPSAGTVVRIEAAQAAPAAVFSGDKVDLKITYAVLTPASNSQVDITESHEIRLNNELVGNPEVNVSRTAGTYTSTIPMFLPKDAKPGTYKVISTIKTVSGKDARETSFTVR